MSNNIGGVLFSPNLTFSDGQLAVQCGDTLILGETSHSAWVYGFNIAINADQNVTVNCANISASVATSVEVICPDLDFDFTSGAFTVRDDATMCFEATASQISVVSAGNLFLYAGGGLGVHIGANGSSWSFRGNEFWSPATKVLGTRVTGWGAPTGTPTRTTFATSTVTLPQLAERLKALIDDLTAHGLIGA